MRLKCEAYQYEGIGAGEENKGRSGHESAKFQASGRIVDLWRFKARQSVLGDGSSFIKTSWK